MKDLIHNFIDQLEANQHEPGITEFLNSIRHSLMRFSKDNVAVNTRITNLLMDIRKNPNAKPFDGNSGQTPKESTQKPRVAYGFKPDQFNRPQPIPRTAPPADQVMKQTDGKSEREDQVTLKQNNELFKIFNAGTGALLNTTPQEFIELTKKLGIAWQYEHDSIQSAWEREFEIQVRKRLQI